jgi:FxsC-like protein
VPQGHAGADPAPYFFLGYAHTPERPWVEKLFRDICAEVMERTTLPVTADVGFMDGSAIPLGGDWREEVARALATCRVFVPLYSPRYFTRIECGFEWHAFAQRILDHRARHPGNPTPIVPALWTPVLNKDMPDAASRIQMNHADLGAEYADEGFYTLIKNTLYRQQYVTAVQRLAQHIIRAAETSQLRQCQVRDFGPPRNAFDMPGRRAPADRRLTLVVAAPTVDRLPAGRSTDFYGDSSNDWNPFHPASRQPIAEYAAGVARLNSYEPTVLPFDEGYEFLASCEPSEGLGLLLVDAWASAEEGIARRLREVDALELDWVATMVLWNMDDAQTRSRADELRERLRALLPHRLGDARPLAPVSPSKIITLERFRARLPDVLDAALFHYLNHVEAHPPDGAIPPRPRLHRRGDEPADREAEDRGVVDADRSRW